jgi:hypothetical protein
MPTSFLWLGQGDTAGDWMAASAAPGKYRGVAQAIGVANSSGVPSVILSSSQQNNDAYISVLQSVGAWSLVVPLWRGIPNKTAPVDGFVLPQLNPSTINRGIS